jgi:hypothetical protein
MKYKIVRTDTYNSLLRCIDKALDNNYELRKVCQCRECKHYGYLLSTGDERCKNPKSVNHLEEMNPYGSCEKCERR